MKQILFFPLFIFFFINLQSCVKKEKRVLVFSKTEGYRHASISEGKKALIQIGLIEGFKVDTTEDSNVFNEEKLKDYSAVVFLSTTGNVLNAGQENAFMRYIQAGGGFVGIHAATDTEYEWPWYNRLVGAYFQSHPEIQTAKLQVVDQGHESTKHLDKTWERRDEWYNFKSLHPLTKKLLTIDESSYKGGKNGKDHPMAWYHEYDGGRAWYTALGHTEESYTEENFIKHIAGGIRYAIGNNKRDYSKAKIALRPEDDRFSVDKLVEGQLFEPTEMTILPNLDVLIAQRRGEILKYDHANKSIAQVGKIDVYHDAGIKGVNAEEGLMGIQKDPEFDKNKLIYLFYAVKDSAINRLSQLKFEGDSINIKNEKIILDVASTRQICCHTGGSIAFSADGQYLFVSTGDNTTPFDQPNQKFQSNGYGPIDNRPGLEQYDAQRTSANTNDLRGKILRLKRNSDATFSIPDDNLFKKGNPKARAEIYVMGNRNPYRISVDPKTHNLYWGEVGPDAGENSDIKGPRGYDEVNEAKAPGNFGWPMFVGANYAYADFDYQKGVAGDRFDAKAPKNRSKNNTGLETLPAAQPALIYYPYAQSDTFPELGSGGRNAMAGPVYYTDLFPSTTRLHDYFNGKLFIYDWIRGWIKTVNVSGDYQIEPFLEGHDFANIIDMEVAPTGEIYLLEYGKGWFSKNNDASLSKVVYNAGNRRPKIENFELAQDAGKIPFVMKAKVVAKDPDNDPLTYEWKVGQKTIKTSVAELEYEFKEVAQAKVTCRVLDGKGNETMSKPIIVSAGNDYPEVTVKVEGNQSMYFPNQSIKYAVEVNDENPIEPKGIFIEDKMVNERQANFGHLAVGTTSIGESLVAASDCASCHKHNEQSIGPAYTDVAKRYQNQPSANTYLAEKIRLGGSGNWGEGAMAAHPNITVNESEQIANWILSLTGTTKEKKSLPTKGAVFPKMDNTKSRDNVFSIQASYTDLPTNKAKPLSTAKAFSLKPNYINDNQLYADGLERKRVDDKEKVYIKGNEVNIDLQAIDLFGIRGLSIQTFGDQLSNTYTYELIEKESDKVLSTITSNKTGQISLKIAKADISKIQDYRLQIKKQKEDQGQVQISKLTFVPGF